MSDAKKEHPAGNKGKAGEKAKHAGGRPTLYRKEFCESLIAFFDVEPWEERKIQHYKDGNPTWEDIKRLPRRMPTLRGYAKSINVSISAVYDWVEEKNGAFQPEFLHAFTQAKRIRRDWLIDVGLSGGAPPASFKFVAVNCTDMRDKQDHDITSDGKPLAAPTLIIHQPELKKDGS